MLSFLFGASGRLFGWSAAHSSPPLPSIAIVGNRRHSDGANMARFVIEALEPDTFLEKRKALSLIRCCAGIVRYWGKCAFLVSRLAGEAVTVVLNQITF